MTRRNGLVDALDTIVDVGASVSGDAVIQLAGIDLIRLDLRLLLAGVEEDVTGSPPGGPGGSGATPAPGPTRRAPLPATARRTGATAPAAASEPGALRRTAGGEGDATTLDQGLGRLVLAVIELVRQLLERQAVRRMRADSLDDRQLERLGNALKTLESRTAELRDALGVSRSEVDRALDSIDELLAAPSPGRAGGRGGRRR